MKVILDGFLNETSTFDYDSYTNYDEETKSHASVWIPILYSLTMVLGLLGNAVLLAVLVQRRCWWSVSDALILHMSAADVMLLLVVAPFRAAQATHLRGSFGSFCKICGALFHIHFYVSTFVLVCLCLDHYLSTSHPARWRSHRTPAFAQFICLLVWISALLLSIPDWIFLQEREEERLMCVYDYGQVKTNSIIMSRMLHHLLGFLIPAVVLILLFTYILPPVLHNCKGQQRRKAVTLIFPLVLAFFLLWLPYNVTFFVDTTLKSSSSKTPEKSLENPLKFPLLITSLLGYLHAGLRPALYWLLCGKFKSQVLSLVKGSKSESKSSMWELGLYEKPPQLQDQLTEELKPMTGPVQTSES